MLVSHGDCPVARSSLGLSSRTAPGSRERGRGRRDRGDVTGGRRAVGSDVVRWPIEGCVHRDGTRTWVVVADEPFPVSHRVIPNTEPVITVPRHAMLRSDRLDGLLRTSVADARKFAQCVNRCDWNARHYLIELRSRTPRRVRGSVGSY